MIEKIFLGLPVDFYDICKIYPLKVIDVVQDPNIFKYVYPLIISQEDIEDQWVEEEKDLGTMLSPLEYLLNLVYNSQEAREAIEKGFEILTHSKVTFIFKLKKIMFGDAEEILTTVTSIDEIKTLDEDNYFEFQNLIRLCLGRKKEKEYEFEPDPRIRKMKAKARYRDKVKAKNGEGLSFSSAIESVCCMQIGITPLNVGELSYSALYSLLKRFEEVQKFDIDLHSIWAGADPKKHNITPKNWIRNLE